MSIGSQGSFFGPEKVANDVKNTTKNVVNINSKTQDGSNFETFLLDKISPSESAKKAVEAVNSKIIEPVEPVPELSVQNENVVNDEDVSGKVVNMKLADKAYKCNVDSVKVWENMNKTIMDI
jgi:hypothetical protein